MLVMCFLTLELRASLTPNASVCLHKPVEIIND